MLKWNSTNTTNVNLTDWTSCEHNGNCIKYQLDSHQNNRTNSKKNHSDTGFLRISELETATMFFEEAVKKKEVFVDYFAKHFPKVQNDKFMIYKCSGGGLCGGWGDRLRGLYSVYLLSLLQNRTFGLDMKKPCSIEKFIQPAVLNWTVQKKNINGKRAGHLTILDRKSPPLTLLQILTQVPTADVVSITFNEDYLDAFKSHKHILEMTPNISELPTVDIARSIYHGLFRYEHSFEKEIKHFFDVAFTGFHLIGVHIRVDKTRLQERDLETIWKFLDQFRSKDKYKVFIASDTQSVKDKARSLFPTQYIGLPGTIIHTDTRLLRSANACDGLKLSLFDHAILVRSQILLLTPSGFGIEAARARHTSDNLFCYIKKERKVIRCQRESLKTLYHR